MAEGKRDQPEPGVSGAPAPSGCSGSQTLAARLWAERRRSLVGRQAERALFQRILMEPAPTFHLLYLYGPGGIGKTTLLREFVDLCAQGGTAIFSLNGGNMAPTPEGFLRALGEGMGVEPHDSPSRALAADGRRKVLLVDRYEALAPLDTWMREVFLPGLPDHLVVVLASRCAPSGHWREDPGWRSLLCELPLGNLGPEASQGYLSLRGVPAEQHRAILAFTHGHPLALSLVTDLFAQRPDFRFQPEAAPDVLAVLVSRLVQELPDAAHRRALEACATVRVLTEPLLAAMVPAAPADVLFDWLRGLSIVESGVRGLHVHDLVRDALIMDLRWRNPEGYAELRRRAQAYYAVRLPGTDHAEQEGMLADYFFLYRDHPAVRPYFVSYRGSDSLGTVTVTETAGEADGPALLEMVRVHEGAEAARIAAYWLARQPESMLVLRDGRGQIAAFIGILALQDVQPADLATDPGVRAAWEYLQRAGQPGSDNRASFVRFWLARDADQAAAFLHARMFVTMMRHFLTTPGLSFSLIACADPDSWAPRWEQTAFHRLSGTDFALAERRYGIFGRDWRQLSPLQWLTNLAEGQRLPGVATAAPEPDGLGQAEFAAAVRDALRDFCLPTALRRSPLLCCRIVQAEAGPQAGPVERVAALRERIRREAEGLQSAPRRAKLYRALLHTYFQPAASQEQAAELLGLPFSTFRGHLKAAVTSLTAALWQAEIGGD